MRAAWAVRWGFAPESPHLVAALTHGSAEASPDRGNERLEFLGDAVLGLAAAEFVMRALPGAAEGVLSRARAQIARKETLADAARALGIEAILAVGAGEVRTGGRLRDGILADTYEALIGALYLDAGPDAARDFIHETLAPVLAAVRDAPPPPDPKTQLQMLLQAQGRGLPAYRTVAQSGRGHAMRFGVEVLVGTDVLGRGEGSSKRAAQAEAAAAALEILAQGE